MDQTKHELVGREPERRKFAEILGSPRAELVAIYGRRRVGKTFLIDQICGPSMRFKLVGRSDGNLEENLKNFATALGKMTRSSAELKPPDSWPEAFQQLEKALSRLRSKGKIVVFFDEFPWLDTKRSGFLGAFEHFWNTWASGRNNLVCVICGSAAAWMIRQVVSQKGGLYNRVTRKIHLKPFTLREVEEYLTMLGSPLPRPQIIEIYLSLGGIPFYYNSVKHTQSAAQIIQSVCFDESADLAGEFQHLFRALFENHRRHTKIVEILAKTHQGINRQELLKKTGMSSGGWFTETLEELEASGFIASYIPYGKNNNAALYRVIDEFVLFHLKWMKAKPVSKRRVSTRTDWTQLRGTPAWQVWAGYAFENVCWNHIFSIKQTLQIGAVLTNESPWRHQGRAGGKDAGAQIDMLIDRKDDVIHLCEMKYTQAPFVISASYKRELLQKMEVFRAKAKVPKRCAILLTLLSPFGLEPNGHAREMNPVVLDLEALFL